MSRRGRKKRQADFGLSLSHSDYPQIKPLLGLQILQHLMVINNLKLFRMLSKFRPLPPTDQTHSQPFPTIKTNAILCNGPGVRGGGCDGRPFPWDDMASPAEIEFLFGPVCVTAVCSSLRMCVRPCLRKARVSGTPDMRIRRKVLSAQTNCGKKKGPVCVDELWQSDSEAETAAPTSPTWDPEPG